jgi:hypothetical protein
VARFTSVGRLVDDQTMAERGEPPMRRTDELFGEASGRLERARADAEQIRRDALVTAEGIRQIAREDAKAISGGAGVPEDAASEIAALRARVRRLERKLKRQGRRVERLEDVLLGLAPGLRKKR